MGRPSPQNCLFPSKNLDHRLIHGSLSPRMSSIQTASRSVQQFLQGSLVWLGKLPIVNLQLLSILSLSTVLLTFYIDSTYSSLTIMNYYCLSYVRRCWALVDWRHSKCCLIWYMRWWYDRPTDHATRSVKLGRHIYVRSTAMRPKNNRMTAASTLGKLFTPMCLCHQAV